MSPFSSTALGYRDPMIMDQYSYTSVFENRFENRYRYRLASEIELLQQEIREEYGWADTHKKVMAREQCRINNIGNRLSLVQNQSSLEARTLRARLTECRNKYHTARTDFLNASGTAKILDGERKRKQRRLDSMQYFID